MTPLPHRHAITKKILDPFPPKAVTSFMDVRQGKMKINVSVVCYLLRKPHFLRKSAVRFFITLQSLLQKKKTFTTKASPKVDIKDMRF